MPHQPWHGGCFIEGMFSGVFLALPLLLPVSQPTVEARDIFADVTRIKSEAFQARVAPPAHSDSVIPPLYAREDRGLLLMLSPGSPCTAACLRLKVTF